jgi:small-conductance mechanosensitive channel
MIIVPYAYAQDKSESKPDSLQDSSAAYINMIFDTVTATKPTLSWSVTLGKLFWCILIIFLAFILLKYLIRPFDMLSQRSTRIGNYLNKLIPIIRILFWTCVTYILVVGVITPPGETFFIILAIIGITVALSLQDFFKNIMGGIVILFERPFKIKDKIMICDHYGEIIRIGLRAIRIRTVTNSVVTIPNSEILNNSVVNRNAGKSICQVATDFYLPPDADITEAKKIAYRAASVSRFIYLNKPITVTVKNEVYDGRSLIKLTLTAFVLDISYETLFASEMTETVMNALTHHDVTSTDTSVYSQLKAKKVG